MGERVGEGVGERGVEDMGEEVGEGVREGVEERGGEDMGEEVGEGVEERGGEDVREGVEVGEGVDANFTPMIYKVVGAIVEPEIYVIYNQQWCLF